MSATRDSKRMGALRVASRPQASGDAPKESGDCSVDARVAAEPSKKPTSPVIRAEKRVALPPPAPPPPPVLRNARDTLSDNFLDLEFSRPIEQSLPDIADEVLSGSLLETALTVDESSRSHSRAIETAASADSELMPNDSFECVDDSEEEDGAVCLESVRSRAARDHLERPENERPAHEPKQVPPTLDLVAFSPMAHGSGRKAARVERARLLIASQEFSDALDLIELVRASGDDDIAKDLERECRLAQSSRVALGTPTVGSAKPAGSAPTTFVSTKMMWPLMVQPLPPRLPAVAPRGSIVAPLPPQPKTVLPEVEPLDELGGLSAVLTVVANSAVVRALDLDHRAGFLLSLIDGFSSVEDLLDLANMPCQLALTLLADLKRRGLVK